MRRALSGEVVSGCWSRRSVQWRMTSKIPPTSRAVRAAASASETAGPSPASVARCAMTCSASRRQAGRTRSGRCRPPAGRRHWDTGCGTAPRARRRSRRAGGRGHRTGSGPPGLLGAHGRAQGIADRARHGVVAVTEVLVEDLPTDIGANVLSPRGADQPAWLPRPRRPDVSAMLKILRDRPGRRLTDARGDLRRGRRRCQPPSPRSAVSASPTYIEWWSSATWSRRRPAAKVASCAPSAARMALCCSLLPRR